MWPSSRKEKYEIKNKQPDWEGKYIDSWQRLHKKRNRGQRKKKGGQRGTEQNLGLFTFGGKREIKKGAPPQRFPGLAIPFEIRGGETGPEERENVTLYRLEMESPRIKEGWEN